ncbi:hypothetical protein HZA43_02980 [Candidatus Peregrinibacteria bacterium]|nr:hypothetical protein [Candidatus Peregrinibacteria bacterium]
MKINITKEQYKNLIIMSGLTSHVFGILGDALPEADYKKQSQKMDELEEYFLQYADDFGYGEWIEKFEGKNMMSWEKRQVEEICEVEYGYTEKAKSDGDYRFVRITDTDENGLLT